MLPSRMKDLEKVREYGRYQLETREDTGWIQGSVYACPPEKLPLLLRVLNLGEDQRLQRIVTGHADMALVTDTIVTRVVV